MKKAAEDPAGETDEADTASDDSMVSQLVGEAAETEVLETVF
jgi:hypothetical protein